MALLMRKISQEAQELLLKWQTPGNGLYFSTNEVFTALLESCKSFPPEDWKFWLEKDQGLELRDEILRCYRQIGGQLLDSDNTLFQRIKATPPIKGLYHAFLVKLYDASTPKVGKMISCREREKVLGKEIVQDYVDFKKLTTANSYWNLRITLPKDLVEHYKYANVEKSEYADIAYFREDLSDDEGFDVKSSPNISEEQLPEEHMVGIFESRYNDCKKRVVEVTLAKNALEAELAVIETAKKSAVSKKRRNQDLQKVAKKFSKFGNQSLEDVTEAIKSFKKLGETITRRSFGMEVLEAMFIEPSSVGRSHKTTSVANPEVRDDVAGTQSNQEESSKTDHAPDNPLDESKVEEPVPQVVLHIVEQVEVPNTASKSELPPAKTDDTVTMENKLVSDAPSAVEATVLTEKEPVDMQENSDSEEDDAKTDEYSKSDSYAGIFANQDDAPSDEPQ